MLFVFHSFFFSAFIFFYGKENYAMAIGVFCRRLLPIYNLFFSNSKSVPQRFFNLNRYSLAYW